MEALPSIEVVVEKLNGLGVFCTRGQRIGRVPVETMPVVCTVFELLTVVA